MADQDTPVLQLFIQRPAADFVGSHKQEVGLAGQYREAQGRQGLGGPLPGGHDGSAFLPVVGFGVHGGLPQPEGQAVDVVGVDGILDFFQVCDQGGGPQGVAQPGTGHGPGLGEGADHHQVFIFLHQRIGALAAEVHIGLVDGHHRIGIGLQNPLDLGAGQAQARGSIGVGDDDEAVQAVVLDGIDGKIRFQGDHRGLYAAELSENGIKAVADIREGGAVLSVGPEEEVQHLVGAVAHIDVLGLQTVELR